MKSLWQPLRLGNLDLPHRVVMAPMTRDRATASGAPTEMMVEYYAQRASNALIVSEGTQPSDDGQGYLLTPGVYTAEHIEGWRKVTDAVHSKGGRIFIQLMHAGRVAHPENTPHQRQPVAPSALTPAGSMFTMKGLLPLPEPRALSTAEVRATVEDFRRAARAAIDAGADGVEIHGANGYLVQQFLSTNSNQRTDEYGGSIANRIRFAVEVARAISEEIGPERTAIRLSPGNTYNDIAETDTPELYVALVEALAPLRLAYLHVVAGRDPELVKVLRSKWSTVFLLNRPGAPIEEREADLSSGLADLISVGTMALANPDLVERLRLGAGLNDPDRTTFFGGDAKGYTDYPTLPVAVV